MVAEREIVVVVSGEHQEAARGAFGDLVSVRVWPEEITDGRALLEEILGGEASPVVAVYGGDELVGEVVTAYWGDARLGQWPLELWPLKVGRGRVAEFAGGITPQRAAKAIGRGIDRWETSRVKSLRVSASMEEAARIGFSFAAGWVQQALKARQQATRGLGELAGAVGELAAGALEGGDNASAAERLTINYEPVNEIGSSVVVSSLERTYFGLRGAGAKPRAWTGLTASELMRQRVAPGALSDPVGEGKTFETLHLDQPRGWTLDGRSIDSERPGVVQIVAGPTVSLLLPRQRWRDRATNLLG